MAKRSKWSPDKKLPHKTIDEWGRDVITGNWGTPLMGYWQWVDDDTISWSLTKNSRKQAIKLGAETGGFLEAIYYQYEGGLSDRPDGIQRFEMFRDSNKTSRLLPVYGWEFSEPGFSGWYDIKGSEKLSQTKDTNKKYVLIYEHGSPVGADTDRFGEYRMDTKFALLNEENFQVAATKI